MHTATVGKFRFDYDSETKRILIFREGDGVDPISIITVTNIKGEKDFHYEVMSWLADTQHNF
jgi:hypothetical protein